MAQNPEPAPQSSPAVTLLAPREEEVVHGKEVTFSWEAHQRMHVYRLQVAADPGFEQILVDQTVGLATSHFVGDRFATDERTYFWRVLSEDVRGRVHGQDVIESFISGTPEDTALHAVSPDRQESLGPVAELMTAASEQAVAEVKGDDEYFEQEVEMGVAPEGIEAGQIIGIALAIVAAVFMAVIVVFNWTNLVRQQVELVAVEASGYPDLQENRLEAAQRLNQYEVIDAEAGVYRIPIDRAMDLIVTESSEQTGRTYSPELPLRPRN